MSIINRFPSGGGGSTPAAVSRSDVNFYDYDGTLLFCIHSRASKCPCRASHCTNAYRANLPRMELYSCGS